MNAEKWKKLFDALKDRDFFEKWKSAVVEYDSVMAAPGDIVRTGEEAKKTQVIIEKLADKKSVFDFELIQAFHWADIEIPEQMGAAPREWEWPEGISAEVIPFLRMIQKRSTPYLLNRKGGIDGASLW